jgi:PGF-pre-PGF domain-containing protein
VPNKPVVLKVDDICIIELIIYPKETIKNARVKMRDMLSLIDTGISGIIYSTLGIVTEDIEQADLDRTVIRFKVERRWLADNRVNAESVSLYIYDGAAMWKKAELERKADDDEIIYYEAVSDIIGPIIVAGEPVEEPSVNVTSMQAPEKDDSGRILLIGMVSIILPLAILIWMKFKRKKTKTI